MKNNIHKNIFSNYREIFNNQFDDEVDPSYKHQYVSLILNDGSAVTNKNLNKFSKNISATNNQKINLIDNNTDFLNNNINQINSNTGNSTNLMSELTDVFSTMNIPSISSNNMVLLNLNAENNNLTNNNIGNKENFLFFCFLLFTF